MLATTMASRYEKAKKMLNKVKNLAKKDIKAIFFSDEKISSMTRRATGGFVTTLVWSLWDMVMWYPKIMSAGFWYAQTFIRCIPFFLLRRHY